MSKVTIIVGTDTGIGKTFACCRIMQDLINKKQETCVTIKPISSGLINNCALGAINEDVYLLNQINSYKLDIATLNPFSFKEAIAPHIASQINNLPLNVAAVRNKIFSIINNLSYIDNIFFEGVGGIMTPLNTQETFLDLLIKLQFPVVIVVGIKLGCLNHALLTMQLLNDNNVNVIGWIANCIDINMQYQPENIDYLKQKLTTPLLYSFPYDI